MQLPAGKRRLSGEQFVSETSERVDVCAVISRWITGGLLGRHVCRRAEAGACTRKCFARSESLCGAHGLRDSEISYDSSVAGQQNVLRLDVAVNDSVLVRVTEGACYITQNADCFGKRLGTFAFEFRAKRQSLDERHRVIRKPSGIAGRVQRYDVRMLQPRSDFYLARKPLGVHARGELWGENLDDDLASERRIGRQEHARHPAAAELPFELVGVSECGLELLAKRTRHGESTCQGHQNLGQASRVSQLDAHASSEER